MRFDDDEVASYLKDHGRACGKRLQDLRKIRRLTQSQLAEIAGVTQPMISMAEVGLRTPHLSGRMKICAALSVEHDDVWPSPDRIHFASRTVA